MIQYENERYVVGLNDEGDGYRVINKTTYVVEFKSESLPRCLIVADEHNNYLEKREAPSKQPASAQLHLFQARDSDV